MSAKKARLLMVDDERRLLDACRRNLSRTYAVDVAEGGEEGLKALRENEVYAVVITDMNMPGLSGVEFLEEAHKLNLDSVYMMLTGNADQATAVNAINQGKIFRFLNKPCPVDQMVVAINDAIRQYELVTTEREVLRGTLVGSVKMMVDMMAVAQPITAHRNSEIRRMVKQVVDALKLPNAWQHELAGTLCLVGLMSMQYVKPEDQQKDETLKEAAEIGARLIKHIPRMEGVSQIIGQQRQMCYDMDKVSLDDGAQSIAVGGQVLHIAVDLEEALRRHGNPEDAFKSLQSKSEHYDLRLLRVYAELYLGSQSELTRIERKQVQLWALEPGMVLESPLMAGTKMLFMKGTELTSSVIEQIRQSCGEHPSLVDRMFAVYVETQSKASNTKDSQAA